MCETGAIDDGIFRLGSVFLYFLWGLCECVIFVLFVDFVCVCVNCMQM